MRRHRTYTDVVNGCTSTETQMVIKYRQITGQQSHKFTSWNNLKWIECIELRAETNQISQSDGMLFAMRLPSNQSLLRIAQNTCWSGRNVNMFTLVSAVHCTIWGNGQCWHISVSIKVACIILSRWLTTGITHLKITAEHFQFFGGRWTFAFRRDFQRFGQFGT